MIQPMESRMGDRRLALCVVIAVAALLCGAACVAMSEPVLGAVAGALGVIAGALGVWASIDRVHAMQELDTALKNNSRLHRELDALSATYAEQVKPPPTRATLVPSARERAEHAFDP